MIQKTLITLIIILSPFIFVLSGYSAKIVIDNNNEASFTQNLYYYKDTANKLSIQSILKSPNKHSFNKIKGNKLNPGYTQSAYWIKFTLHNKTKKNKQLLFSINYPLLNYVNFYKTDNNNIIESYHTGEDKPFSSREIKNRNFVFNLDIPSDKSRTYYAYVFNNGETLRIPMEIDTKDSYYEKDSFDLSINTLYYGFLIFAFIFNIFLFFNIRDRIYIFFSLYVLFLGLFLMNTDGISVKLFWQDAVWWAKRSTLFFVCLANVFLVLFSQGFLKINTVIPAMRKVIYIILAIIIILFIGAFTNYPYYTYDQMLINIATLINTLLIMSIAIIALNRKYKPAFLFFISFVILLLGVSLYIFRNLGILPETILTQNGVKLGFAIQVLFLSFAVTDRFKKILKDANERLEVLVQERTNKIENQKNEIEAQRDYVSQQRDKIAKQNKEITDSIKYAKRIQSAVLPTSKTLDDSLDDNFIFYRPRDIVSGDFYWIDKKGDKVIIVAADCTGHGVPGAFMSMLGITLFSETINKIYTDNKEKFEANFILDNLKENVIHTLSKSGEEESVKDGMDMSLCIWSPKTMTLQFCGAHNPLYVFNNGKLKVYKGDNLTVGNNVNDHLSFTKHNINLKKGDTFYIFSDGYIDQLGGENKKSFRSRRFKELLGSIQDYPMNKQKEIINDKFMEWKGDHEQIDDVMVIGIRV